MWHSLHRARALCKSTGIRKLFQIRAALVARAVAPAPSGLHAGASLRADENMLGSARCNVGYLCLEGLAHDADVHVAVRLARSCCAHTLYVYFPSYSWVDARLMDLLGMIYGELAYDSPRFQFVPLLAAHGWTAEASAALPDVRAVFLCNSAVTYNGSLPVHQLQQDLASTPLLHPQIPEVNNVILHGTEVIWPEGVQPGPLSFERVALGGTFDRLHAGHRLLLAAAVAIATKELFIGVTDDKLLVSKAYKSLLQSYDERLDAVAQFVRAMSSQLEQTFLPLRDPSEPTRAETATEVSAIVVSAETLKGAHAINDGRAKRGFPLLTIVVVPVVGAMSSGDKLSSTALRAADARQLKPRGQ